MITGVDYKGDKGGVNDETNIEKEDDRYSESDIAASGLPTVFIKPTVRHTPGTYYRGLFWSHSLFLFSLLTNYPDPLLNQFLGLG